MMEVKRSYHTNGAIAAEVTEIDGAPHGVTRHWHPNGAPAMEIPMSRGIIDGTVKQWNDKGELLGSCEINKGTGTYRMWHPNGQLMGETSMIDGKWTGRQLAYFDTGELVGETYWLENEKVSKKRYLEASKQNPNLPRYEDEPKSGAKNPQKKAGKLPNRPIRSPDELPLKLLQGARVREALAWLEESRQPSRSLGEATGQDESIRLVRELHSLGAVAVHAVEIDGAANDDQNTGRLVIELSQDQKQRKKVLEFCGDIAREAGFDPALDIGQRYLLLMLD
jgi:hypothetical protein